MTSGLTGAGKSGDLRARPLSIGRIDVRWEGKPVTEFSSHGATALKHFTFLISTERSGSNFITSLMNGHSRICGPPPSHLFRLFGTNRGNYGALRSEKNWKTLIDDVALSFRCKLGSWSTTTTARELEQQARKRTVAELLRLVYEKEAEHDGASHLFVKENHTYSFAPFLVAHFPDCRFVWLVRDPRDVASSWVSTRSIPEGVAKAVEVWRKDQTASLALYHQLCDTDRIRRVRYEDLVRDPSRVLRGLTEFLDLPFEGRMLDSYNQRRTVENAGRIDAWANLRRPILRDNTGKYASVLSPADVRYVELACCEMMGHLDYTCDLVSECPDARTLDIELDRLRPEIDPGGYSIPSDEEQEIRARRLAAINRVLARRL